MRWFWLALIVVFIAAGVMVFRSPTAPPAGGAAGQSAPAGRQAVDGGTDQPKVVETKPEIVRPAELKPEAAKPAELKLAELKPVETAPMTEAKPAEAAAVVAKPADAKAAPTGADLVKELFPESNATLLPGASVDGASAEAKAAKDSSEAEDAASAGDFVFPEHAVFKGDKSLKSKGVQRADGSLLLDDKYVLKGAGTETDPYIVPWEMLASAQDVYKPRLGQTRMPQRITMLDGAVVKVTGFIAFPITATSPKEALVMLNQWDGCCIGTPPTAYDAIEVRLAKAASGSVRLTTEGSFMGILRVDPFEDNGWLLGLYLMDNATLKPAD